MALPTNLNTASVAIFSALLSICTAIQFEPVGHLVNILSAPRPINRAIVTFAPVAQSRQAWFGDIAMNETNTSQPSCRNKYGPMCGDCNTLWTCVGSSEPVLVQNCEETHPGKPLCERNACTATVASNSNCSAHLQCTGQGYFPNPINCAQYYFCAGAGGESLVYECPVGFVYNAATLRCRRLTADNCARIECDRNINKYAEYPADRKLYAYCLRQLGVLKPIMLRCPGEYHRFNETEQRCVFECPAEGRFDDYADSGAYYECLDDGADGWHVEHQRCLQGFTFHMWMQRCWANESSSWGQQTFNEVNGNSGNYIGNGGGGNQSMTTPNSTTPGWILN